MTSRMRTFDPRTAHARPPVAALDDRACKDVDTRVFYPGRGHSPDRAVAVCRVCPHVAACLAWALATEQVFGIWGGKTPEERAALLGR